MVTQSVRPFFITMKLSIALLPCLLAVADTALFDWGTVSATGLLGWYLWYNTKVIHPRQEQRIETIHKLCRDEVRCQRQHYEDVINSMQEQHQLRHEQILTGLRSISQQIRDD